MSDTEVIICFENTSGAVMAEQDLQAAGFAVQVMPVPATVRAGCGFCLRFAPDAGRSAAAFLRERGVCGIEAYTRNRADGVVSYVKIDIAHEINGANDEQ
ncbi:MAG: DUF3343 domain-containing protein [Treponema sp.]|nr:DUF3343 domain-containing protein [Treponema sp.]